MFCHQCGAGIDDPSDRFCSRCGAPLQRGGAADRPGPGPQSPLAEPAADRLRRPISAWPDRRRERIQLPLTELRQRRARESGEPVPLPPATVASPAGEPPAPEHPAFPDVGIPGIGIPDEGVPEAAGAPEEPLSNSRSRAEAALLRMVPPKEAWAIENQPGPAERAGVRDEWPGPAPREDGEPPSEPSAPAPPPVAAVAAPEAPPREDPIIAWLEPPVTPVRPAPPSREAKAEEGPIIVPRDYDENAARQRKGRRRVAKPRGPLIDPASLGRSIRPSWILAIAGVILLTLIVFAIFPPGGGNEDGAGPDQVNRHTGMPIHTVATPVRPTAGTPAIVVDTPVTTPAAVTAEPAASSLIPGLGVLPGGATPAPETTVAPATPPAGAVAETGAAGIRVVVSSAGGWSGTIGQQADTYTETPVVGSGTQARTITGPVTMVTANIQKLDQTTDLLEVRVEQDGVLLKSGRTTEPAGIVALSVLV